MCLTGVSSNVAVRHPHEEYFLQESFLFHLVQERKGSKTPRPNATRSSGSLAFLLALVKYTTFADSVGRRATKYMEGEACDECYR